MGIGVRLLYSQSFGVPVLSEDKVSPFWIEQNTLVAATLDQKRLVTLDFKSGNWSDLLPTEVVEFMPSPDGKYVYYTTGGSDPMAMRIRLADHNVETLTTLKDLRRVADYDTNTTQLSVAPDGSPVFTRDIGTGNLRPHRKVAVINSRVRRKPAAIFGDWRKWLRLSRVRNPRLQVPYCGSR